MLERLEGEPFAGNAEVFTRVGGDDQENAGIGPALVELSSRVEVPGSITEHRGDPRAVTDLTPELAQLALQPLVRPEVREQRAVIAGAEQREEGRRLGRPERLQGRSARRQRRAVREGLGWRAGGQASGFLIGIE